MKRTIGICIVLLFLIVLGIWSIQKYRSYQFNAQSVEGKISMKDFEGSYKIVYFGYMSCPDVCPSTLFILGEVLKILNRDDIVVLFVTLDPERDKLPALDDYAKYFYTNSYGLWFEPNILEKIISHYGVSSQKIPLQNSALQYSIAHSSSLYIFDKQGFLLQEFNNLATLQEDLETFFANHQG